MGYTFIFSSVLCSLALAHLLKLSKRSEPRLINILTINYLIASAISFFISDFELIRSTSFIGSGVIVAVFLGSIFIANLFVYSAALDKIGMGISIAAMRMSLIIPITLSLFLYDESIQLYKYGGIILVFIAMFLMIPKVDKSKVNKLSNALFPILLFVMTGIADFSLKVYEKEFSSSLTEYGFLSITFISAGLIGAIYLIKTKNFNFNNKEILFGFLVGIVNLYSSFFLLLALKEMLGSLVFLITNVANIVLGSMIGIFFWKEVQSKMQKLGIALAIISILIIL